MILDCIEAESVCDGRPTIRNFRSGLVLHTGRHSDWISGAAPAWPRAAAGDRAAPRSALTALAAELGSLRERIGRSSRNSSKPPSSDGPGLSRQSGLKAGGDREELEIPDQYLFRSGDGGARSGPAWFMLK